MLNFIPRTAGRSSPAHYLYLLRVQIHPFSSSSLLEPIQNSLNQESFTVNYLMNSCGFSPENALSASKHVKFKSPSKPDSVLAFLEEHEFTKTQISTLIRKFPAVLLCNPQTTLLPKLEFLKSKGLSRADVATMISRSPYFMKSSLENTIIPSFNSCSNLIQSEEKTIAAIKRSASTFLYAEHTQLAPNIEILRGAGVPNANVMWLLKHPKAFMLSSDRFRQVVEDIERMGFNPLRISFLYAIYALRAMTKSTWEKKVEVYRKWGWTDDEILVAFKKHPYCMMASEDKINGVMNFFVNKMGLESLLVARRPKLVSLSLEKRIVPRCAVYQVLLSKGLIKTNGIGLTNMVECPEKQFLKKFVNCYEEEAPKLLKLFKEKLELAT